MSENQYSLRNETKLKSRIVQRVKYRIETRTYVGLRIWNSVPFEVKDSSAFGEFNTKIRRLTPENCPCKLSKTYVQPAEYLHCMTCFCCWWCYYYDYYDYYYYYYCCYYYYYYYYYCYG